METTVNKPASNRTLWALKLATKIDYRGMGLTQEQASQILKQANEKSGYQGKLKPMPANIVKAPAKNVAPRVHSPKTDNVSLSTLFLQYATENVDRLVHSLVEETNIVSGLANDKLVSKDTRVKWVFIGSGCGFAWLEYRKTEKNKALEALCQKHKKTIDRLVIKAIDKTLIAQMEKCGNPLQAHQMQNEKYNITWCWIVADFMRKQGVKNVYANSRQD